jgi:hypothetical protein
MDQLIVLTIIAACAGSVAFGLLLRKLATGPRTLPVTAEWIDELSVERYRPMVRLLSEDDMRFVASQPGFTPKMAREFRAQRYKIVCSYLGWLQADFERVCTALRVLMLQSQHDRPDLAMVLMRQRAMFVAGMAAVRFRLILYRWGIAGVDVNLVMSVFDSLRLELRQLVPVGAGAQA